jgi:hypothetical protein
MIERCLHSCFQQVYPNIEIIIVDNNSTDRTMEIARQLANTTSYRVLLSNCYQQGANYARNYGFTQAKGDYIQWLDADDELTPNKIAMQVCVLEKERNYDIAYGDWDWCFWRNGRRRATFTFKAKQYDDYLLQLLVDNWQPPHAYLLRREAASQLHELQAWHPQRNMDREYFTLAALLGYRFLYVPDVGIRYNSWSSNQITKSTSYTNHVQNLKTIFQRFQRQANEQSGSWIEEKHKFLLRQNWDLWSLASISIVQQQEQGCFLMNNSTQEMRPASFSEATIVSVMQQLPGVRTLEDHARKIVSWLWQALLQPPNLDSSIVAQQLAKLVGLPVETVFTLKPQKQDFLKSAITTSSHAAKINQKALIDTICLYAPSFVGEQRLAILKVLEQLRLKGFLNKLEVCSQ